MIKRIKYKVENIKFVAYKSERRVGVISAVVLTGKGYFDFLNNVLVDNLNIVHSEPLTNYIKCDDEVLTKSQAKKYAQMHMNDFSANFKKIISNEKLIFADDNNFYEMI